MTKGQLRGTQNPWGFFTDALVKLIFYSIIRKNTFESNASYLFKEN